MKRKILLALMIISIIAGPASVKVYAQGSILDEYIRIGIENNITIQKANLSYEKSLAILHEARGYFLPGLSFNARYTIARGGRVFEFPAGEMFNPLFQNITALNSAMAAINPGFPALPPYPSVDNISFRFFRPTEHETKLSVVQPLFNPALYYNYRIRKVETLIGLDNIEISRRTLVKQISDAYHDYLRSAGYQRIADELVTLATENLRICTSLWNNNMITRDILYKAEADLAEARMKLAEAAGAVNSSRALFNFHLNRDLREPVIADTTLMPLLPAFTLMEGIEESTDRRPELAVMERWLEANNLFIRLNRAEALPVVAGAADYGFQGEKYRFGKEDDFMLASVVLRWNIAAGSTARNKTRQAMLDREILELSRQEMEKQIELQVISAWYNMLTAHEAAEAAAAALEPASASYHIVRARFREGQESYGHLLESQTLLTRAREEMLDRQYRFMKEKTAFMMATGKITTK